MESIWITKKIKIDSTGLKKSFKLYLQYKDN